MFVRWKNPLPTFLLSYYVWVTSKIQVNFRCRRYSKVLRIVSYRLLNFFHYLCFRGQEIHCWHSYGTTVFRWPRQLRSTSGSRGSLWYLWFCLMNAHNFFSIYVFEVKLFIAGIPTELSCHVWVTSNFSDNPLYMSYSPWVTSKTFRTGNCFEFSRSSKHSSSVEMSANVSLTLKTYILKILRKSIRHNHQYLWEPPIRQNHQYLVNRKLSLIFKVTQTW